MDSTSIPVRHAPSAVELDFLRSIQPAAPYNPASALARHIATRSGLPVSIVLQHLVAAGLGAEVRT